MTGADRLPFAQAFNRLAVATRLPSGEADAAMQQVYWRHMEDIPIAFVVAAADALEKSSHWFPKVAEWREWATRLRLQSVIALPDGREDPWREECDACDDTGWEIQRCYPGTVKNCGRRKCIKGTLIHPCYAALYEHTYTVPCQCRATNRTYQRHRAKVADNRY